MLTLILIITTHHTYAQTKSMMNTTTASNQTSKSMHALAAIIVVGLSMCFLLYKYLLQIFPSVMTTQLRAQYHLSGFGLGNLAACFFYAYFVMQIAAGPILDRFSLKLVSGLAMFIAAIGAFLFASAHSLFPAVIGRILMGVGAAYATVSYLKMTAIYFKPRYFSIIGGMLTLGVMLGALFGQAPMAYLSKQLGWQHSVYLIAIVGIVLSAGYVAFPQPLQSTNTKQSALAGMRHILSQRSNWYLLFYSGLAFSPLAVFGGLWGTPFVREAVHISTIEASSMVSLVYVGFGIGGPLFGYLARRSNNLYRCMFWGLVLSLLSVSIFIYAPLQNHTIESLLLFLFGAGTGAFMLGFSLGKNINPPLLAATVIAVINTGDAFFGAITEPIIGKVLDMYSPSPLKATTAFSLHSYHIALALLPLYISLGFVFLRLLKNKCTTH